MVVAAPRSAADLESSMEKAPVTPGAVVLARELLADLLLETGQSVDALREYEATLATDPNRFRSVFGAAHAAEQSGDLAKARRYYESAAALTTRAYEAPGAAGRRGVPGEAVICTARASDAGWHCEPHGRDEGGALT